MNNIATLSEPLDREIREYTCRSLPEHLWEARQIQEWCYVLSDFEYLQEKIQAGLVQELITDFRPASSEEVPSSQRDVLFHIKDVLQLCSHIVASDPSQFAGQLLGRLGATETKRLTQLRIQALHKGGACLRPLASSLIHASGPLIRTIVVSPEVLERVENAWVKAIAISPDGNSLICAISDNSLRLLDLRLLNSPHHMTRYKHSFGYKWQNTVAITPDSRYCLSGDNDGVITIWGLEKGEMLRQLRGHTDSVNGLAISLDGRRAVSASKDQSLIVWDLQCDKAIHTLYGHTDEIQAVVVTNDGCRAISGGDDETVRIWDLELGKELATLRGHKHSVDSIMITPDSRTAISGSFRTLRFWDLQSFTAVRVLQDPSLSASSLAITPDGQWLLANTVDSQIQVWNIEQGVVANVFEGHGESITSIVVSSDGHQALSASIDNTIKFWDLSRLDTPSLLPSHTNEVRAVAITPNGQRAVSVSLDKTLMVWDVPHTTEVCTIAKSKAQLRAAVVTPDGHFAITGAADRSLRQWNLETGRVVRSFRGHQHEINSIALSLDGKTLVSGSSDQTVRVWDVHTGRQKYRLHGHKAWVVGVNVTYNGRFAVSTDSVRCKVWDLKDGCILLTAEHLHGDAVAILPDGSRIIALDIDNNLVVLDVATGAIVHQISDRLGSPAHTSRVFCLAVTADGQRLFSASEDGKLKVWDMNQQKLLATFTAESG